MSELITKLDNKAAKSVQLRLVCYHTWSPQPVMVCKRAPGRSARHHALNDLIARILASAGMPATKEPQVCFGRKGNDLMV